MASPTVRDLAASILRSTVAAGVGTVLAAIARRTGIVVDEATGAGLVQGFTFIVIALYYIVVRGLETKIPAFGWLLGLAKLPNYASPANTVPEVPSDTVPTK
jgi:hypothetical protein